MDTKMPPKQQYRIEGTIFVPKNAALTEGGENGAIFGAKLVSKTGTVFAANFCESYFNRNNLLSGSDASREVFVYSPLPQMKVKFMVFSI
ncbi:MAG: hypothetical protein J0665_21150 [Deltaproteobacteria bacterium]|nr:hypothetical protein [Deltaproteobacteria bacterium]